MSNANEIQMLRGEESAFGVVATAGNVMRITGEGIGGDVGYTQSQELRADRQVAARIRNSVAAGGDTNHELSFSSFDEEFQSVLLSTAWSRSGTNTSVVAAAACTFAAGTIAIDAGTFVNDPAAFEWIYVTGSANAANNGFHKVASVAGSNTITTEAGGMTVEAGVTLTVVILSQITNGTTFRSHTLEREYTDLTNEFERILGAVADGFNLDVTADAIVTLGFSWLGKIASSETSSFDASPTAANANEPMNGIDNVPRVYEGGALVTDDIISIGASLSNSHRPRQKVGTLGAFSMGTGTMDLTGTLTAFFESSTLFNKYLNATASSFAVAFEDVDGNGLVIDIPRLKYTGGRRVGGGLDQDIIADLQWGAYRHETELITLRIARYTAP